MGFKRSVKTAIYRKRKGTKRKFHKAPTVRPWKKKVIHT